MTRKAKVFGVLECGSKAVILADQEKNKNLLEGAGDFIQFQTGIFKTGIRLLCISGCREN